MIENHGCLSFLNGLHGRIWHKESDIEAYISLTADKKYTKIYK